MLTPGQVFWSPGLRTAREAQLVLQGAVQIALAQALVPTSGPDLTMTQAMASALAQVQVPPGTRFCFEASALCLSF